MSEICRHGLEEAWCSYCNNRAAVSDAVVTKPAPVGEWQHEIRVGEVDGRRTAEFRSLVGTSADRVAGTGQAVVWQGSLPDLVFELNYETWNHGSRQVSFHFVHGPLRFIGLHGRHNLMVYRTRQGSWVSLHNQSRLSPEAEDRPVKRTPTLADLSDGARLEDPIAVFRNLGATKVGEGRHVLGAASKRPHDLCVMFDHDNEAVPIGAFLISRVLPLWHRYVGSGKRSLTA